MKRFKDILFVVAGDGAPDAALSRAIKLADNNQARLTVVEVIERVTAGIRMPDGGPISEQLQATMAEEAAKRLDALIAPHASRVEIATAVLAGSPFLEVIREVLRGGHDLVIKSPDSPEWLDRFFGSDDMHLLRKCPCPVWVVKPQAEKPYRRVLVAIDVDDFGSAEEVAAEHALNLQLLEMAAGQALAEFAELHVVHVWDAIGEGTMRSAFVRMSDADVASYVRQVRRDREIAVNALLGELGRSVGREGIDYLKPRTHLLKGSPRREIPLLVERIGADLVVMGTVARTGIPGFIMGNTAETILNQISCSVLAIKPPGFETPVTEED